MSIFLGYLVYPRGAHFSSQMRAMSSFSLVGMVVWFTIWRIDGVNNVIMIIIIIP